MTDELKNWSVLATRAMNDAFITLDTIDPEDTIKGKMLRDLRGILRELVVHGFVLNGVMTRKQLDDKFHFGKLAL